MSRRLTYVPCSFKFELVVRQRKVLPHHVRRTCPGVESYATSSIWSGAVIEPGLATDESFSNAAASWTVRNAYPPVSASTDTNKWTDGTYLCLAWVGINGNGGTDVAQTGTVSRVIASGGNIT